MGQLRPESVMSWTRPQPGSEWTVPGDFACRTSLSDNGRPTRTSAGQSTRFVVPRRYRFPNHSNNRAVRLGGRALLSMPPGWNCSSRAAGPILTDCFLQSCPPIDRRATQYGRSGTIRGGIPRGEWGPAFLRLGAWCLHSTGHSTSSGRRRPN